MCQALSCALGRFRHIDLQYTLRATGKVELTRSAFVSVARAEQCMAHSVPQYCDHLSMLLHTALACLVRTTLIGKGITVLQPAWTCWRYWCTIGER
eukprot:16388-Heterococcus_DN1.PRE.4